MKRKPPDEKFSLDELPAIANRLCHILFGEDHMAADTNLVSAVMISLQVLVFGLDRQGVRSIAERLCYSIAWNKFELLAGRPLSVWSGSPIYHWALHSVLSVEENDSHLPMQLRNYLVKTRVLTSAAAGSVCERIFSRKALVYISPILGFSKKPSDKQNGKPLKHPRMLDVQELVGLSWLGLLEPGHEYPPKYFEIACKPPIMKANRELIRSRSSGNAIRRQPALVQSQPRSNVPDSPDNPPGLLQHGK